MKDDSDTLKKKRRERGKKRKNNMFPRWASLEVFALTHSHQENPCALIEKSEPQTPHVWF